MSLSKNRVLFIVSLLLLAVLAVPVAAQDGGSVTMIVTRDPISFDPHDAIDPGAPVILAYIYDTLVYQDTNGVILPSLAEDWTVSDDGLQITFTLREGVVFSDGSPLNADAVIFTFERLQNEGVRSLIFDDIVNITGFEKVDDLTVRFLLAEPQATLLSSLTYAYAAILSPEATTAAGDDYGQNPVGTGPFMLESWTPESELTLVPNPLYAGHRPWTDVDGPPSISELTIRFSRDQSALASALLAGEADIAYLAGGSQVIRFAGNDDFLQLDSPARGLNYVGFNTGRAPFDDPEVRRALAAAINKEDILLIAADGLGEIVDVPLPPSVLGYDADLGELAPAYDPDAAREALARAGYNEDNPLEITILTSTFPTFQTIATVMQAQFEEIGVVAGVEVLDFSAVVELANAGEYDMLVTRYDWNDPDVLRRYLGTENIGTTNRYFYSVPELDTLFAAGRTTFDQAARIEAYREAQQIILRAMPLIPLYVPVTKVIVNTRVENVDLLHSHVILDAAQVSD